MYSDSMQLFLSPKIQIRTMFSINTSVLIFRSEIARRYPGATPQKALLAELFDTHPVQNFSKKCHGNSKIRYGGKMCKARASTNAEFVRIKGDKTV